MRIIITKSRVALLILAPIVFLTALLFLDDRYTSDGRLQGPERQTLKIDIPNSPWVPAFFEALEARTSVVNLPNLRTVIMPADDFEVRFWYDRLGEIDGVVIRRAGQAWSADWVYQTEDHLPSSAKLVNLGPPKSGWEAMWKNLTNTG